MLPAGHAVVLMAGHCRTMTGSLPAGFATPPDHPDRPPSLAMGVALNATAIEALREHIRSIPVAPRRLDLDCGTVRALDPVGAALLLLLCRDIEEGVGTRIRLTHLPHVVAQQLRSHPLQHYVALGEEIFADPFASPLPSNR